MNAVLRLKKHELIDGIGLQGHFTAIGDELNMELIKVVRMCFLNIL